MLSGRLKALEQAVAQVAERCPTCGGPPDVDGTVLLFEAAELEKCPRCGFSLTPEGNPMGPGGTVVRVGPSSPLKKGHASGDARLGLK